MSHLYTIGHSNRSIDDFLELIKTYEVSLLIDVRAFPGSRRLPWFNKESLGKALNEKAGINYLHMPELGGRRKPLKESINQGWRNSGFRGYADYMQTPEFDEALKKLNKLIKKDKTVIMCAEALPWQCHRSLIADAELIRNIEIQHIMSPNMVKNHKLTEFAQVDKTQKLIKIIYPKSQNDLFDDKLT